MKYLVMLGLGKLMWVMSAHTAAWMRADAATMSSMDARGSVLSTLNASSMVGTMPAGGRWCVVHALSRYRAMWTWNLRISVNLTSACTMPDVRTHSCTTWIAAGRVDARRARLSKDGHVLILRQV